MKPIVEFRKVTKLFGSRKILSSVNFAIYPGDIVGILGESGAGKSTILRLISGLEKPDMGIVTIKAKNIGYVFQEPRLLENESVITNVSLPMIAKGYTQLQARTKAEKYIESMYMDDFKKAYPSELSGGMKQRVSLARALALEPELILLDEPSTGLDKKLKQDIFSLLEKNALQNGSTILHVTHEKQELLSSTKYLLKVNKCCVETAMIHCL